ncbi:hypothetical protein KKR91_16475 [Arthrobacter jiangjiafuii]|uniref:Transmembrane protein (PGPGW) n=1 Tax=Arthrobacter jiangjiafuii TaxID=2817475 RepID=A0A975M5I8_9MICC|nr:PGPGW domain-containing protein [Arthrobacter jiangjiafuii]MBP3042216.1 hypothetical protein [Arthrobacter jiangjiafuii]QWC10014.1 hypothetical protein KKR91_16475 [Arthrobacter jiangjiafuii]
MATDGEKHSRILPGWVRRTGIEVAGWTLVLLGLAALVLPGPGLLALAAGLAVLSLQYHWAGRYLRPLKAKALHAAEQGVCTWPRISASVSGALAVIAAGIIWGTWTEIPPWWPLADTYWLPGGWGTGAGLMLSGLIALTLIFYSCYRFRGRQPAEPAAEPPVADAAEAA